MERGWGARADARLPWVAVVAGCVLGTATLAVFVRDHSFSLYDDAYIYLRYVRSLRAGCGLRFNCEDAPVEGFTSPLYLALLVVGSLVTTRLVLLTQVLCTLAVAGTLGLAVHAASSTAWGDHSLSTKSAVDLRAGVVLVVAAVLGLDHYVMVNAVVGLEAPVAALVVTAAWAAVLHDRRRTAIALVVLAFLARPEGLLLVAFLPVMPWARTWRVAGTLVASVAAITLARWLLFHDFVPNTYWAKAGGTQRHVELGLQYLTRLLSDQFPFVLFAPLALLVKKTRSAVAYLLAVSAAWLAFFLRSGGDVFPYGRLAFPIIPALTVLSARGVAEAGLRAASRVRTLSAHAPLVGVLLLVIAGGGLAGRAMKEHGLAGRHSDPKVDRWHVLAQHLAASYPHATIATVPIGALAYYSRLRVIDMLGLTTPAVAKAGRTIPPELLTENWIGHERHNLEWVLAQKPDLVVTTQFRETPWDRLDETRAGFYAEWLFVRAVKEGRAPYHVVDAEIAPQVHFLLFERDAAAGP